MSIDLRSHSIAVIRAGQHPSGAYVASPNFDTYSYSWLRDGSFIAYGMDCANQHDSALAFHCWVDRTVQSVAHKIDVLEAKANAEQPIDPSDWLHCRYTLDGLEGQDHWGNFQLDGYGAWLWALCQHVQATGTAALLAELEGSVSLVVRYLCRFWDRPNYDCWEEHPEEAHASTLACLYGGLRAINEYRQDARIDQTCQQIAAYVLEHFVHQGRLTKFQNGASVDANLLWVSVPFGLLAPTDPIMLATVAELERRCLNGGLHRYPEDTYYGGGQWILLTAWLSWYYLQVGRVSEARRLLHWIEENTDKNGEMTEQVTTCVNDPGMIQHWVDNWGPVAKPLLWSHAMYLVLQAELAIETREESEAG